MIRPSIRIASPPLLVLFYLCAPLGPARAAYAQIQHVTLPNGKTFEVATDKGLPRRFKSNDIQVRDIGITARFTAADSMSPLPFVWVVLARVKARGHFSVTITSPLDDTVSTTFEFTGPGDLVQSFFPAADYPTVWAGLEASDTSWFPFRFEFVDSASERRFALMQWAQLDAATLAEGRQMVEQLRQRMRQLEQRRDSTPPQERSHRPGHSVQPVLELKFVVQH